MKHIKLFESYFYGSNFPNPSLLNEIVDGLDTLDEYAEAGGIIFKDYVGAISDDNRHYSPEEQYARIEQEYNDKDSAYKAICDFLGENPKDIVVFWNVNNLGGDGIVRHGEKGVRDENGKLLRYEMEDNSELKNWFFSSIDKLFGRYIDIRGSREALAYGPQPMEYLGSPKKTILVQEEDVYYNKISMWISPDGLKFVSWGWEQSIDWMCTRTLIKSAFSSLKK
jgi:hypothetical protein